VNSDWCLSMVVSRFCYIILLKYRSRPISILGSSFP
jgi:hypothetical protein